MFLDIASKSKASSFARFAFVAIAGADVGRAFEKNKVKQLGEH